MLERIVIFDRFSASLSSKTFRTLHLKITQELLDSTVFPEERSHTGLTLFEFGSNYYIDPIENKKHRKLLKQAVPPASRPKVLRSIENNSGLFFSEFGIGSVNPYVKVMLNLAPLLQRYEAKQLERNREFEVARLFFRDNLSKIQICRSLHMTRAKLEKVVRRFSYRTGNLLNSHSQREASPDRILLANVGAIMKRLRRTKFRMQSLREQLNTLQVKIPEMEAVNLRHYTTFVKKHLGLKYRQYGRTYKDPDKNDILKVRKLVAFTLAKLHTRDCIVVFFDSSSFSDTSFKKFMWTLGKQGSINVNVKKVYGHVNLLMATSAERILNYWIANSVNAITTASFLYETIRHCRNTLGYRKVVVFMDNARIHKTTLLKNLAAKMKVYFLLNSPYSSKINQVEYVFELIKRPFRHRNDKGTWTGLAKLVRNRLIELGDVALDRQTVRYWKYLLYAVKGIKFWASNK